MIILLYLFHVVGVQQKAGDPERLVLGIEERILDGDQPLADDAPGRRACQTIELGIDQFMVEYRLPNNPPGEPLDYGADPERTKPRRTRSSRRSLRPPSA